MAEYAWYPLMLWVKLPAINRIQPQSNKFAVGVENKATLLVTQNIISIDEEDSAQSCIPLTAVCCESFIQHFQ